MVCVPWSHMFEHLKTLSLPKSPKIAVGTGGIWRAFRKWNPTKGHQETALKLYGLAPLPVYFLFSRLQSNVSLRLGPLCLPCLLTCLPHHGGLHPSVTVSQIDLLLCYVAFVVVLYLRKKKVAKIAVLKDVPL